MPDPAPFDIAFYVIADDGSKYGPADRATLKQWANEGRVLATTMLENSMSGVRKTALEIIPDCFAGQARLGGPMGQINHPSVQTPGYGDPYASARQTFDPNQPNPQPRYLGQYDGYDVGQEDFRVSLICSIIGFFCCGLLSIVGIFYGVRAYQKGHRHGVLAIVIGIVVTLLNFSFIAFSPLRSFL